MKLKYVATTILLLGALMASACANTIKGAGQDTANTVNAVQGAGHKVAKAAQ
jgi:entericidin B